MAKVSKVQRKSDCRRHRVSPYLLPSHSSKEDVQQRKCLKKGKEREWKEATCSVCMEYPHNAVLLLCSSYNKGCRPYMCATSYRYSNCLEQYKKAYTKVSTQSTEPWDGSIGNLTSSSGLGCPIEETEVSELLCPLCRGQVKGWTVVESAREYLNTKRRNCTQDACSFVGTYKELRKHVRTDHPRACPREVDPSLAEKWKRLEHERERNDVISTIRSSMPGAIVFGDYVIEGNYRGFSGNYDVDDYLDDALFRLESFGGGRNDRLGSLGIFEDIRVPRSVSLSASIRADDDNSLSRVSRYHSRSVLGRSRRRRRPSGR